jgi:hypothetical protein
MRAVERIGDSTKVEDWVLLWCITPSDFARGGDDVEGNWRCGVVWVLKLFGL